MYEIMTRTLAAELKKLQGIKPEKLVAARREKFLKIGVYEEKK